LLLKEQLSQNFAANMRLATKITPRLWRISANTGMPKAVGEIVIGKKLIPQRNGGQHRLRLYPQKLFQKFSALQTK